MSPKQKPPSLWKALKEAEIADDVDEILSMSDAELDAFLVTNGADPAKIAADGEALARELDERRDRLAWHDTERKKLSTFQSTAAALRSTPRPTLTRAELLARITLARNDPRFTAPVNTLFRNKTPEASTDEELQALLDQITLLTGLEDE